MNYGAAMDRILMVFVRQLKEGKSDLVKSMMDFPGIRYILAEIYEAKRRKGLCEDITQIHTEEKKRLWEEAKQWTTSKDKAELHQVCKAIIVIGSKL